MSALVTFRDFEPQDSVEISAKLSAELLRLGLTEDPSSIAEGMALKRGGPAWTAVGRDGEILCCAGFLETAPGLQASAWAMLAPVIGPAHLAITRFARWQIRTSPIFRIDALVARRPRELAWARLCGLREWAHLGPWACGDELEDIVLFSRMRPLPREDHE